VALAELPLMAEEIRRQQTADPEINTLITYLMSHELPEDIPEITMKTMIAEANQYDLVDGMLCHKGNDGTHLPVVPHNLKYAVVQSAHAGIAGGHLGVKNVAARFWVILLNFMMFQPDQIFP